MSDAESILAHQTRYGDDHITLRFLGFNPSSRQCQLAVDEKHPNVGFYYIWVTFGSGDETRIDYDGGNPNRNTRPIAESNHYNDTLKDIRAKRVRD